MQRKFKLAPQVEYVRHQCGFTYEELEDMVQRAAPYTSSEGFNRRFHEWMFKVEADQIARMSLSYWLYIGDWIVEQGRSFQVEDHEACEGRGCTDCGWRGEVRRYV